MKIYGVCISDIEKINEEKFLGLLKELAENGHEHYLADFTENKKDNDEDYTADDWLYDFESDGYYGLSAFLKEVIEAVEGVNISCDDPSGIHYLGLRSDAPWNFNEKTKVLSAEEYRAILSKYVGKVTDETLEIRWWCVNDDCDV